MLCKVLWFLCWFLQLQTCILPQFHLVILLSIFKSCSFPCKSIFPWLAYLCLCISPLSVSVCLCLFVEQCSAPDVAECKAFWFETLSLNMIVRMLCKGLAIWGQNAEGISSYSHLNNIHGSIFLFDFIHITSLSLPFHLFVSIFSIPGLLLCSLESEVWANWDAWPKALLLYLHFTMVYVCQENATWWR